MTPNFSQLDRVSIINEIVGKKPGIGRTALMKCLFFLTVLKGARLGYSFRLYTYGPFDSDVLGDIQYAEALSAISSTVAHYPGGYAYEYRPGIKSKDIGHSHVVSEDSIDWVVDKFASRSAVDLEMASTLLYVDREQSKRIAKIAICDLVRKVCGIKPHLAAEAVEREAQNMKKEGLLTAVE